LKGAAATALYGSKGANGVVIITTKNGALNKKPLITFSSDFSFENPLLPQIQSKYSH
jgi:TonB-dependent SusC/RagA subfamily outer membrane receptor